MSIDTRLRSGLHAEAEQMPVVEMVDAWATLLDRRERERDTTRTRVATAVLAAAAAVALVAFLFVGPSGDSDNDPAPSPSRTPSPTGSATGATDAAEPAPVEGKWSAGPTPAQAVVDHLDAEGLGQWATAVLEGARPDQTLTYQLTIADGQLVMSRGIDGRAADIVDVESYDIQGERIVIRPEGLGCRSNLTWRVTGQQLRFQLLDSNCPDYQGTPERAYLNALYAALPFTRAS